VSTTVFLYFFHGWVSNCFSKFILLLSNSSRLGFFESIENRIGELVRIVIEWVTEGGSKLESELNSSAGSSSASVIAFIPELEAVPIDFVLLTLLASPGLGVSFKRATKAD
jgi:hypothetical protein